MVKAPPGLAKSTPWIARRCTLTGMSAGILIAVSTSMAFRPNRSTFVTTSVSPGSIFSTSFVNSGQSIAGTPPEITWDAWR